MQYYDLDIQMTLTFNIVIYQLYHFALKFWISVITLSLVNGFTSYPHTILLRSDLFKTMQYYDLDIQMTLTFNIGIYQLYHFALKFWISVITLSLVNGFTSYSHTMLLRSRPFQLHMTEHCDLDLQMALIFNIVL